MPFTTYADQAILNAYCRGASLGAPATRYIGLLVANTWAASTAYSVGQYVIPVTQFAARTGPTGRVFKCTTAGASSGSEPTWPTTAGGTVVDGGATWTEVTNLFEAGTFTGAECTGTGYARISQVSNTTNFGAASSAQPSASVNSLSIGLGSPTSNWGQCVGTFESDAASAGNIWWWGLMVGGAVTIGSGSTPSAAAGALTYTIE